MKILSSSYHVQPVSLKLQLWLLTVFAKPIWPIVDLKKTMGKVKFIKD